MKNVLFTLFLGVLLPLSSVFTNVQAQCANPPLSENTADNGTVSDNANLNNGDIKTVSGSQINANINGGTLIISGTVNMNNLNFNSGTILITSTGIATLPGINFNGNVTIINYGTLKFTGNVILQNDNNRIFNASTTSLLDLGTNNLNFSSGTSFLVNNGVARMAQLLLNSNNAGICMGDGAKLKIQSLINNRDFSITVPSGAACMSYSGDAQMNKQVTDTDKLTICPGPDSYISSAPAGGGYGAATVVTSGCAECDPIITVLPVNLSAFWATPSMEGINLNWRTSLETNNDYFILERSMNGRQFQAISEKIRGQKNSSSMVNYAWTDTQPPYKINYYRLRQVDTDGTVNYSRIVSASLSDQQTMVSVYPNPVSDYFKVQIKNLEPQSTVRISILDQEGKQLSSILTESNKMTDPVSLAGLSTGIYLVKVSYNGEGSVFKILKQ